MPLNHPYFIKLNLPPIYSIYGNVSIREFMLACTQQIQSIFWYLLTAQGYREHTRKFGENWKYLQPCSTFKSSSHNIRSFQLASTFRCVDRRAGAHLQVGGKGVGSLRFHGPREKPYFNGIEICF